MNLSDRDHSSLNFFQRALLETLARRGEKEWTWLSGHQSAAV